MSLSPAAKALGDQPAFPVPQKRLLPDTLIGDHWEYAEPGLTKREWMAVEMAKAVTANASLDPSYEVIAIIALKQTDALLESLAKQEEQT